MDVKTSFAVTVPQLLFLEGLVERAVVRSRSGAVAYCIRVVQERGGLGGPVEVEGRQRRVKIGVSVSREAVAWLDARVGEGWRSRSAVVQACVDRAVGLVAVG